MTIRRRTWFAAGPGLLIGAALAVFMYREYVGWRVDRVRAVLDKVPVTRLSLCRCEPDTTFHLARNDGLRLAASLYGTTPGEPRPAVLILHGMTPFGRRLPIYRVLATALAERGLLVMTVDFAGFGESEDPFLLESLAALERGQDVVTALRFLEGYAGTAPEPITLVGHSMGSIEAMSVGLTDSAVGRIVAIGPPRRTAEFMATVEGRAGYWDRRRRQYDSVYHRPLPAWYSKATYLDYKGRRNIERFMPDWQRTGHRAILLLDGARESAEDRAYLRGYVERMAGPKGYLTVPGADHYLNTGTIFGWTYYDRRAVELTAGAIESWRAPHQPRSRWASQTRTGTPPHQ